MNMRLASITFHLASVVTLAVLGQIALAHEHGAHGKTTAKVIRSAGSGVWSAAKTWEGGQTPKVGEIVQVRAGHTVTYDVHSENVIRSLHVAGTLKFATNKDTRLEVGLIKIQAGDSTEENGFDCEAHLDEPDPKVGRPALLVGTPDEPMPVKHTALIRLHYVEGMDKVSCPAIVCCAGRMDFHGAPLERTWLKLGATAAKGAKEVTLAETPTGWRVGNRIILTSTESTYDKEGLTEPRVITAIEGKTLRF